jgi:hypothetical protein
MSTIKKTPDADVKGGYAAPSASVAYDLWRTSDQGQTDVIYGTTRYLRGGTPPHDHGEDGGHHMDDPILALAIPRHTVEGGAGAPQMGVTYSEQSGTLSFLDDSSRSSKSLTLAPLWVRGGIAGCTVTLAYYWPGAGTLSFDVCIVPLAQVNYRSTAKGVVSQTGTITPAGSAGYKTVTLSNIDLTPLGDAYLDRLFELQIWQRTAASSGNTANLCGIVVRKDTVAGCRPAGLGDPPAARVTATDLMRGALTPELTTKIRRVENSHATALWGRPPGLHADLSPDRSRTYLADVSDVHQHQGISTPQFDGSVVCDGAVLRRPLVCAAYPRNPGWVGSVATVTRAGIKGIRLHPDGDLATRFLHLKYRVSIPSGLRGLELRFALQPEAETAVVTCRVRTDIRTVGTGTSIVTGVSSGRRHRALTQDTDSLWVCEVDPLDNDAYVPNVIRNSQGKGYWTNDALRPVNERPDGMIPAGPGVLVPGFFERVSEGVYYELTHPPTNANDTYRQTQDCVLHLRVEVQTDDTAAWEADARLLWVFAVPQRDQGVVQRQIQARSGAGSYTEPSAGGGGSYLAGNGLSLAGSTFSIDTAVTVDKTTAQTLSNKTLTAPVLGGTVTGTYTLGGTPTLGANLAAGSSKITGLAQGTNSGEAVHAGRTITAGTGLSGGGDLTADRTLSVDTGVTGKSADVQTFTADDTWTKPSGAKWVEVRLTSGGGGGGSGRRGAAGSTRAGGAGGSAGASAISSFPASLLGATESVTVGVGGTGGAAQTANDSPGSAGADGTASWFGTWLTAKEGSGGAAGNTTTSSGGGASNGTVWGIAVASGSGGNGGAGAVGSNAADGTDGAIYSTGGGGGGGVSNLDLARDGGDGGDIDGATYGTPAFAGGSNGVAGGAAAGNGTAINGHQGTGGGGGAGSTTGAGGAGGAGGGPGAGGGGGGASVNGNNSGAGHDGEDGIVIVITYF